MDISTVISTLRQQAWERAKSELRSMECTTWPGSGDEIKFSSLLENIDKFIKEIEDNGLQE